MPTTKTRINITVSTKVEKALEFLAERDNVPLATKASYLIQTAIEIDEDDVLNALASERDTKKAKFIDHENVW